MRRHKVLYILFLLVVVCSVLFLVYGLNPNSYQYALSRRIPKLIAIAMTGSGIAVSSVIFQTVISSDFKGLERCGIHAALRCGGRSQRSGDLRPSCCQTACGTSVCGTILFCSTLLTWK